MFFDTSGPKRAFDLMIVGLALPLLAPILTIAALAVRFSSPGPILFSQTRAGKDGRPFNLWKFRSMRVNAADPTTMGKVTGDNELLTGVGRVIRRLKIDKLPQVFNVVTGQMSIVGPRPTLPEQVVGYSPRQRKRLSVQPGLTGWAQVNGNIGLTWDERIELDLYYIEHMSLWLDLKIIIKTFAVIVGGELRREEALREAGIHRSR